MNTQEIKNQAHKKFDERYKGLYSARFEYTDKDGNRRFEVISLNDAVPKEESLQIISRHVSEFKDGKITDFIENNYFKSFIDEEVALAVSNREKEIVETIKRIKTITFRKEDIINLISKNK